MHRAEDRTAHLSGSTCGKRFALGVAAITVLGAVVRVVVAHQSVFADELSTYWIVSTHNLGGVVSTVHSNAEITPPLSFVLSWLATRIDQTPELLRAPSLVAGVAAIPLTYLLGLRTVGRAPALVAAALVALSPFMIFYSAEARGYELAIALVILSTLAMLAAADTGRVRWWVVYALSSSAAMYTHYTAAFVLSAQLLWLVWAHPRARRAAALANAGAIVAFTPWITGLINDFNSPTTKILSALEPFTFQTIRISLEHWLVGYPYASPRTTVGVVPGVPALVLLGVGIAVLIAGLVLRYRDPSRPRPQLDRSLILVLGLALAAPVGEALVSLVSTNLFGTRNLAVSWPGVALGLAALVWAARAQLRYGALSLIVAAFAVGAARMLEPNLRRPDYGAAARLVDREAAPGDVVMDAAAALSPGPLTGLDAALRRPHRVIRIGTPQQRDHPFSVFDRVAPIATDVRRAVAAARGHRLFVVGQRIPGFPGVSKLTGLLPAGVHLLQRRAFAGIFQMVVFVYSVGPARAR
jgi:Dolichyl-phosphate-mannose-protein mannosyltransferase